MKYVLLNIENERQNSLNQADTIEKIYKYPEDTKSYQLIDNENIT